MAGQYRYISADSHLEVAPERWSPRVPAKYRNLAPHLVRTATGGDGWVVGDMTPREVALDLYGGKGRDVWHPFGQRYEDTPGTGSPEQRLKEQDQDNVDAEVFFPNQAGGPRLWRRIEDDDAYKAMLRAYNDWLAEDYCSVAPDRLIGLGLIPYSSLNDAMAELKYCSKLGLRGIVLHGFPSGVGYPTPEDDTFYGAALDMNMAVTVHIDLDRTGDRAGPLFKYPGASEEALKNLGFTDMVQQCSKFARGGGLNVIQLVLSGVFDRFPKLKIFWAENQIGWVPLFMEMADVRYQRHIHWAGDLLNFKPLARLPSQYIRDHNLWGFQQDRPGVELRHHMNVNHLMWASDFPHQESEWPDSHAVIDWNFAGVPEEERYKMVAGNAIEFFHLDGA